jgi:hypothetical protein
MHITGFPMFVLFVNPADQSAPRLEELDPDPPQKRIGADPDPDQNRSFRGLAPRKASIRNSIDSVRHIWTRVSWWKGTIIGAVKCTFEVWSLRQVNGVWYLGESNWTFYFQDFSSPLFVSLYSRWAASLNLLVYWPRSQKCQVLSHILIAAKRETICSLARGFIGTNRFLQFNPDLPATPPRVMKCCSSDMIKAG